MSSQRRIAASRANGARSRGPVTPEGKERSARNAVRHGLLARTVVLNDEDPSSFETLLSNLVARLQPVDAVELALVEDMAAAQWRQRRIWAIEVELMNQAAAAAPSANGPVSRIANAFRSLASGPEMPLIHRYETRQNRLYQRSLQALRALRAETLPNEPNPISEHPDPAPLDPVDPPPVAAASPTEPPPAPASPEPKPEVPDRMEFVPAIELLRSRGLLPG